MDTNRNSTIMARKSLIQREKKRQKLERNIIRFDPQKEISKLQSLPRNSAPTRLHRRCFLTERSRPNYRDFGLSGHILREMVHACLLRELQDQVVLIFGGVERFGSSHKAHNLEVTGSNLSP
ncbi:hypothetical protein H5410_064110 [Solanum commersonii]|uniref:Uncharacterized protein n=1 Tax=Solanum commersonii TaxID=4109 RepID=A0A9J5W0D7_SOLCO|nr:hypothetical protein H5410_064110 [Solanum commersonii]